VKPLDQAMLDDAGRHPYVVTCEDGLRQGGIGMTITDRLAELTVGRPEPRVRVLGVPSQFLSHAKPDAILADLGLDTAGIVASAVSLMAADHPEGASAPV
jgi:1-deoxy-D-xylulose-5-phosphate synthase